jgi:pyruvate formate lyase activating enzyme
MIFGGFQPLTLTDFPGRVACVIFTQGCNLRCGYCHNSQLIDRKTTAQIAPTEVDILAFLEMRRKKLDGVVVSGGEPTIQPDLLDFLAHVTSLGFEVKLDTNGTNPSIIAEALDRGLIDYIAMDVKHDPMRYAEIAGVAVDPNVLAASRDVLLSSGVACEFRTTLTRLFHNEATMEKIAHFCEGAPRFVLQCVVAAHAMKPEFRRQRSFSPDELQRLKSIIEPFVGNVELSHVDADSAANALFNVFLTTE